MAMSSKSINIFLKSIADATGFTKIREHAKGLTKNMGEVGGSIKKVSEAFGTLGGVFGGAIQNMLKGGIWGMMGEAIKGVIMLYHRWRDAAKKAAEEERKARDEQIKAITEYQSLTEKCYSTSVSAADLRLKKIKDEIDAVNELRKAELELERERLRAAGDKAGAEAITGRIADLDADAAAERIAAEMEAAERRIEAARRMSEDMGPVVSAAKAAYERAVDEEKRAIARVQEHAENSAVGHLTLGANGGFTRAPASAAQRSKAGIEAVAKFRKSDEGKALAESRKGAAEALKSAEDAARRAAAEALDTAERNLANLGMKADALLVREEARAAKAVNDSAEQSAKAAEKAAESIRTAEVKAAQDAARERDRLDRELHARRMDDLRAEIAEQTKGAASLRARAAAAQGEFDRAFAMYRDPTKAEAAIAEERDYRSDLKRLHKDASRYGGKWRIDELSRLMAAGDSQGVAETLDGWRRLKGFTPQVEAMVRASAAERTKTTAEEELRKIEANTAGLAEKLDALLVMKEGA